MRVTCTIHPPIICMILCARAASTLLVPACGFLHGVRRMFGDRKRTIPRDRRRPGEMAPAQPDGTRITADLARLGARV